MPASPETPTDSTLPRPPSRVLAALGRPAEAAPPAPADDTVFRFALTLVLYAIPLVVTLRPVGTPVCDPDVWWHLRVGRWVVEHRAVPDTDPFSAFGQGRPWVAYSWLYEVLLFGLYSAFGLTGVVVYRAGLALAIAAAVHALVLRRGPPTLFAAGLTAACLLALAMLFGERPWLFTILFGTLTLHAVLDFREGRHSLVAPALPLVFVVWANVHIQFVYGLALLTLCLIAPAIDRRLGAGDAGTPAAFGSPAWRQFAGLTATCWLATLLNPYSWRLYGVVVEYATQPGPFRFVNELKALEFREICDWTMLGLALAAAFALGRRAKVTGFDVLLLAGCAVLSFRARRDMWLLVLAAAGILSAGPFPVQAICDRRRTLRTRASLAVCLVVTAAGLGAARGLSPARLERAAAEVFPAAAVHHIAERGYPGPLYNDFNWGGYLIYALPALPVAIDGRTNLHGDERLMRFGATWSGGPDWHDDPDLSSAGVVLADVHEPLAALLAHDERFTLVYEDALARVFVSRNPKH